MKSMAKRVAAVIGSVAIAALVVTLAAPKAVHAIVSTLVTVSNTVANPVPTHQVIPGKPFFGTLEPDPSTGFAASAGPGSSGTLAVTNITISNLGNVTQEVVVFAPTFSGGSTC